MENGSFSSAPSPVQPQQAQGPQAATPMNPTAASIAASTELALRGEVKKLRDEVSELRREALRVRALESEVETLRAVTLMQAEEKVPIRLRELELENQRLKRTNRSLEEKLATMEGDARYRDLLMGGGYSRPADPQPQVAASQESLMEGSLHGMDASVLLGASTQQSGSPNGKVFVLKLGKNPCLSCSTRLSVAERAFDAEKLRLTQANAELQKKLDAALQEIRAVEAWVAPLVQSIQQYPRTAETQHISQLHNFASPSRLTGESQFFGQRVLGSSSSLHAPPAVTPVSRHPWVGAVENATAEQRGSYLDYQTPRHRQW